MLIRNLTVTFSAMAEPAPVLDVLGDPHRRRIVELLAAQPASVQEIADQLPISRPAVSKHLRLLKQAALVEDETQGTRHIYRVRPEGLEAARAYFDALWSEAAARFRLAVDNTRTPRQ